MFTLMSDFLKNSSDEDEPEPELSKNTTTLEPKKIETLEPKTQKREKMEEYL